MGYTAFMDGKHVPLTAEEESERQVKRRARKDGGGILKNHLYTLRIDRNALLVASDWTGLVDTALTNEKLAEWKMYRQHLRNLPDGLDTVDKVKEVTWPEKPA